MLMLISAILYGCDKDSEDKINVDYTLNPVYGRWYKSLTDSTYWVYNFSHDYKLYRGIKEESTLYTDLKFEYSYTIQGDSIILDVKKSPFWRYSIIGKGSNKYLFIEFDENNSIKLIPLCCK